MKYFVVEVLLWFWLGDRDVGELFVVVRDVGGVEIIWLFCFLDGKIDAEEIEKQDED